MARMPGATWRPIDVNHSNGGNSPRVVILHMMQGTLAGTDSWFRNPRARVSSHFGTGKDGTIYQWVDTSDKSWANVDANSHSVTIENEGKVGEALTEAQVHACARILKWSAQEHGVDLRVNNSVSGSGLSYHNMSGSWSLGGTGCPGSRVVSQRGEIVELAGGDLSSSPAPIPSPSVPHDGLTSVRGFLSQQEGVNYRRYLAGVSGRIAEDGIWGPETYAGVRELQGAVGTGVDGLWGPATESAYNAYKARHRRDDDGEDESPTFQRISVDGVLGPQTTRALQTYLDVAVDGVLGPVTIRALQEHISASVDGVWGSQTTRKLQEALNAGRF